MFEIATEEQIWLTKNTTSCNSNTSFSKVLTLKAACIFDSDILIKTVWAKFENHLNF